MAAAKTVHLAPTGSAYIGGVPAVEGDYPAERAAELLAYFPPAFVIAEPAKEPPPTPSDPEPPADPTGTEV
jgi:hypothetical protein